MSFFVSLVCVCLLASLGLFIGLNFFSSFKKKYPRELIDVAVLYFVLLLGSGVLCCLSYIPISLLALIGVGGVSTILISTFISSKIWKYILSVLLCFISVISFYQISNNSLLYSFILTVVWAILWGGFVFFDRFPFVSSIVSLSWLFGIVGIGFFTSVIPEMIVAESVLLGWALIAFSRIHFSNQYQTLGKEVSIFSGFLWAGIWTYFVSKGAFFQTLIAWGYYLFEGLFLLGALFVQKPFVTFVERFSSQPQLKSKALGTVFSHLLILTFLSLMTINMSQNIIPVLLFSLGVVLFNLYFRLTSLEHPVATWKEMFFNTKEAVLTLKDEFKTKISSSKNRKTSSQKTLKKKKVQKRKQKK